MSPRTVPCSDQSLARGDPMYGTASAGSNWLLLELSGAWGPSAFLQSPAIIDPEGPEGRPISIFESGAILMYLARKTGRFYGETERDRIAVEEWLMWQMGGVGPMFGQAHHFMFKPKEVVPYGQKRYHDETKRLYMVMSDRRLHKNDYLAGDFYSIADIAVYPWVSRHERHQVDLNEFPNVKRWFDTISAREAVQKGMAVPFAN